MKKIIPFFMLLFYIGQLRAQLKNNFIYRNAGGIEYLKSTNLILTTKPNDSLLQYSMRLTEKVNYFTVYLNEPEKRKNILSSREY